LPDKVRTPPAAMEKKFKKKGEIRRGRGLDRGKGKKLSFKGKGFPTLWERGNQGSLEGEIRRKKEHQRVLHGGSRVFLSGKKLWAERGVIAEGGRSS